MRLVPNTNLLVVLIVSSIVSACGLAGQSRRADEEAQAHRDSIATAVGSEADTVCYRQVTGRDTTTLHLAMTGQAVSGMLLVKPYEKDRATGRLTGIRAGNRITADWQRSGEGVTQLYTLSLVMTGDTVRWREGERVEEAGKWVLKTPNDGFEYVLVKTACPGGRE